MRRFPRRTLPSASAATVLAVAFLAFASPGSCQPPGMMEASNLTAGLSVNEPGAYQGYTLVAPMMSKTTYLIDMEGRIVNTWESKFTSATCAYLLPNGHLLRPGAERGLMTGGAGAGGRIQEFDWDGNLLWDYSFSTEQHFPHHDICPMPNGNVLFIAWNYKTPEEAVAAGRVPGTVPHQFRPDSIFEVKPTGKTAGEIVWQWHAWDHLIQEIDEKKPNYGEVSEHPELIDINFGTGAFASMVKDPEQLAKLRSLGYVGPADTGDGDGRDDGFRGGMGPPGLVDWMHTNSVAYNPELDQIILSVHEFSEFWVIDHSTTTEEAASHEGGRYGMGGDLLYRWGNPRAYRNGINVDQRLFAQHDAQWIPEGLPGAGNILVFNNGLGRPDGRYSSVDEIIPPVGADGRYAREEYLAFGPERGLWSYSDKEGGFFAMNVSGAQRLPNGNTLICSGPTGELFEVTTDKEVVWKFSDRHGFWGG